MNERADSILTLGRYGDVIVSLPLALDMSRRLGKPTPFIVSADFVWVLDGCSYVEPVIAPFSYNEPREAAEWARGKGFSPRIAQWYGTGEVRIEQNFEREAWRLAGQIQKWGTLPTVFDRRDGHREMVLTDFVEKVAKGRPIVAVALRSHSSPFPYEREVLIALWSIPGIHVTNICCEAERIYDVLGVLDQAVCLVSVDTAALHLARAAKCPVVAITNDRDGGWWASDAPPQTIRRLPYSVGEGMVGPIIKAVERCVRSEDLNIYHIFDDHGTQPRHKRAKVASLETNRRDSGFIPMLFLSSCADRTALGMGDSRDLPFLKEILGTAMKSCTRNGIVLWSNDDGRVRSDTASVLRKYVPIFGAVAIRRDDDHVGAEAFAFTHSWLESNLEKIPDFFCGSPCFDIILRAMIRLERGIVTTPENLATDFPPCDLSERIIEHEPHESEWTRFESYPANVWNRRLAYKWCVSNGLTALSGMFK